MKISLFTLIVLLASCAPSQHNATRSNSNANASNQINPDNASITLADYLKRIPGVQVSTFGSSYQVLVRGNSSFSEQREPLFIINGVNAGSGYERAAPLVDINDIENVRVLKSGSETAQYGMQGNNGVIVITTKK